MMNTPDLVIGPINIGNPGEFSIKDLAEKIISITGSNSKISYFPLPADDPMQRQPDISLAKKELGGWEPIIGIEEGLIYTIDFFKKKLKI